MSDNAFDLLRGEAVKLKLTTTLDPAALNRALTLRTLYGATL